MLASNDVHRDGIGNHSDWLGRAFQGHTTISQGDSTCMSLLREESQLGLFNNQQRTKPHAVIGLPTPHSIGIGPRTSPRL